MTSGILFADITADYSCGTVQDSHLLPFSSLESDTVAFAKLRKVERKTKKLVSFFAETE
jgi:hypothetical protein